ncbi:MAG: hypothetical protein ACFE0Q_08680 [Anaerolineae bacterium]
MFGFLNFRSYSIIGISVAAVCVAIVYFDTNRAVAGFFGTFASDAQRFLGGTITNFIFTPLEMIFMDYYWAVGAGIAWPLVAVWFFLFLIGLGATLIGPAMSELSNIG